MLYSWGGSESICRENRSTFPLRRNRALGSTAILLASLARPSGESESICRETVALFSPPRYRPGGRPFPPCEACHATLGFCDIRLRRKYGSRLGNASRQACRHVPPVVSVSPRPHGCSGRNMPCKFICMALGFLVYLPNYEYFLKSRF